VTVDTGPLKSLPEGADAKAGFHPYVGLYQRSYNSVSSALRELTGCITASEVLPFGLCAEQKQPMAFFNTEITFTEPPV
jgi:hypothetical protein